MRCIQMSRLFSEIKVTNKFVCFVGPLPPPVHGYSLINQRMLEKLYARGIVRVFDVAPRGRGILTGVLNLIRLMRLFARFVSGIGRGQGRALYLPISGGYRQFIDVCFAIVAMLFGLRIFVHHHSFSYLNRRPLFARVVLRLLRGSVHIVLCERMGQLLSDGYAIPKESLRVVSNAAFLGESQQIDRSARVDQKLVLGFLSNITAEKGCFDFIALVKAAVDQGFAVVGMMAGPVQDEIRQSFFDAVGSAGCIKHIGPVYGDEKLRFLSQIDVLMFPTRYANEAEPVTIWEAMQAGVPVLSLSRGCISGMVVNEVGWVIEDSARFIDEGVDAIRHLFANDAVLDEMKLAARAEFEKARYTYTNNLDELLLEMSGR